MSPALHCLLAIVLAAAPAEAPDAERLAAQLGSASWAEREAAAQKLLALGRAAVPQLKQALESQDPEVRRRARQLIDRLSWEVPSGLSERVSAVMRHYPNLPEREQAAILNDVVRELRAGAAPILLQALRTESSPAVRSVALRHLVSLDRAAAETELRAIATDQPAATWAWAALGDLLAGRGEADEAIAAYERARKAGSTDERMTEALARLYTRKGAWARARDLYAALVAADPESGSYRLQLGRCHHMLGDQAKAEAVWRDVIRAQGNDPNAYIWLARAYEGVGAGDKALAALREGTKRHPEAFELLRQLAATLADGQEFDEAIAFYQRAQRAAQSDYQRGALNQEFTGRLRNSGLLAGYLRSEEADLAELDARIAALLRRLAEAHEQAGERTAARTTLQRLLALYPDSPQGRWAAQRLRELGPGE